MTTPHPHRISSVTFVTTVPRQTPQNDFGSVFARTVHEGIQRGSALLSPLISASPALSTAVSGASQVTGMVTAPQTPQAIPSSTGKGEQWDLLEAQRLLQQQGQSFNTQYLSLQNEIQRESREYNTVSNIMKVRHESAKAAITNIR